MASLGGTPGSRNSLRLSPNKMRNRGSGELVEFCAESLQGSKQYVRQELAQDPAGHDLLLPQQQQQPPVALPEVPSLPDPFLAEDSSASIGLASALSPPCPSPELDALAAVSSGSSYGSSHGGDSQPGSASSITRAFPMELAADALLHNSEAQAAGAAASSEEEEIVCNIVTASPQLAQLVSKRGEDYPATGPPLPLPLPRDLPKLASCPQLACLECGAAVAAGGLLSPGSSMERKSSLLAGSSAPLSSPAGGLRIGAARSMVDEIDFVTPAGLSLTPIRTRTTEAAEPTESPPAAYADSLAPPSDPCLPKVLPAIRGVINIHATSSYANVAAAAPGAYNPYAAGVGGGGYGGGRSYGYNYGCKPSEPATTSSTSCYWASQQQRAAADGRPPVHSVGARLAAMAASAGDQRQQQKAVQQQQSKQVAGAASPYYDDEVEHIVMVPGGLRRQQSSPRLDDEVEHIVMVPGMRRRTSKAACLQPAAELGAPPLESPAVPDNTVEAYVSVAAAGRDKVCCTPAGAACMDKAAGNQDAVLETLPAKACAVATGVAPGPHKNGGGRLFKEIIKAALMVGFAVAAVSGRH